MNLNLTKYCCILMYQHIAILKQTRNNAMDLVFTRYIVSLILFNDNDDVDEIRIFQTERKKI